LQSNPALPARNLIDNSLMPTIAKSWLLSACFALEWMAFYFLTATAPCQNGGARAVMDISVQSDAPIRVASGMGQSQTQRESRKIIQWATDVFLNPDPEKKMARTSEFDARTPFSFVYKGAKSADFLPKWNRAVKNEGVTNDVRKYTITYTDKRTKLEVRCELKIFTDFPALDWVLYFKNTGDKDTPLIKDVLPLDAGLSIQAKPMYNEIKKHHVTMPSGRPQPVSEAMSFGPVSAWSAGLDISQANYAPSQFPFYNIEWGKTNGVVFAFGWTGPLEVEWSSRYPSLTDSNNMAFKMQAGQDPINLKLYPGEEIRTPRILLMYWQGKDWLRGNNLLRQLLITHYLPRYPDGALKFPPVACAGKDFAETEQGSLRTIDRIAETGANAYWPNPA